jgi:hypothetical protein
MGRNPAANKKGRLTDRRNVKEVCEVVTDRPLSFPDRSYQHR